MSHTDRVIAQNLERAARLWKKLQLLRYTLAIGTLALLIVLAVGVALDGGWFGRGTATALLVLSGAAFVAAWLVAALVVAVTPPDRPTLARATEAVAAPLLDRLNTLVHLEDSGQSEKLPSYCERIRVQAGEVLRCSPPPAPFSPRPIARSAAVFLATAVGTLSFHARFDPWRLPPPLLAQTPAPEPAIDIPPPPSDATEAEAVWGEVRISEPGRDLKVNKFETVPLQIEAAASRPIDKLAWYTAVNGGPETSHPLDGQTDPRYSVHRPVLRAADVPLAEWDVLTYYAKATTQDGSTFQSATYFIEVVPLRHELAELPGGTDSQSYRLLNELTGMIEEQQEVIRQTYRHAQSGNSAADEPSRQRRELAGTERDLGQLSRHLGAWSAGKLGDTATSRLRQRLAGADKALQQAAEALDNAALEAAQGAERHALADLIAARKALQDAIRQNPEAFAQKPAGAAPSPEELRAAERQTQQSLEFVQKTIAEEQQIRKQAGQINRAQAPALAEQQQRLQKSLDEFAQQRPAAFADLDAERAECAQAMAAAGKQLQAANPAAAAEVDRALGALRQLAAGLRAKEHEQKLAEAHQLKQLLEDKARLFEQVERHPEKFAPDKLRGEADQTRSAAQRLRELAEQPPTRDDFAPQLRDALSPPNLDRLDGL